jgi:tetratricopeptide (TPR) repeat protein
MYVMGYLVPEGRLDEALTQMQAAKSKDPISTRVESLLGLVYYYRRDYDRAIEQFKVPLQLEPGDKATKLALGSAYERKAKFAEAIVSFEEGKGVWRSGMDTSMLAHTYALMGRRPEAEAIIQELLQLSKTAYISPAFIASIYAGLGDKDRTMEWLEKAYAVRAASLVMLKVNPRYDIVRSDPRFQDLLRRVHLD